MGLIETTGITRSEARTRLAAVRSAADRPFMWHPIPWIAGATFLLALQLAAGTDLIFALLIFAFVILTGLCIAALDGAVTLMGLCVACLGFQHVILCQTMKALLFQRPDTPLLQPVTTAAVYVVGMSSLLTAAFLWGRIRPRRLKPLFTRELDPRRLLWMTIICFVFGLGRFILSHKGSQIIAINAANLFEPLAIVAGTAYLIVSSNGRRSFGWANLLPIALTFTTGILGAGRSNIVMGPVIYYLTCYLFQFRFRLIHLGVLLAGAYLASFILFPYALYARGFVRTKDFDTNVARASDLLVDVAMNPVKYQEMEQSDKHVGREFRRLRYFGKRSPFMDRLSVILSADAIVDATELKGTLGMKLIQPGFDSLLPRYLNPTKDSAGTSNALAHRARGLVNKNDHLTQITLGFFCDSFSSFGWAGIAIIPGSILLGFCFSYSILFDMVLRQNVFPIGLTLLAAGSFSESTIASQIINMFQGFFLLWIVLWMIRGLINLTQNFHAARWEVSAGLDKQADRRLARFAIARSIGRNARMNVLVYQIGSLGDTLVSIPAYRAVRRHFGSAARIRVLHNAPDDRRAVPPDILVGTGLIDGSLSFPQYGGRSNWKTWLHLWGKLIASQTDAVVYVAPSDRPPATVRRDQRFFKLCGVRKLYGFHAYNPEMFAERDPLGRPVLLPHEARLRLDRLARDGIEIVNLDLTTPLLTPEAGSVTAVEQWLGPRRRHPERALIAICPGANQPANIWPSARFTEIGRRMISLGRYELLIVGGAAESELGEQMVSVWGEGINAAGQFDIQGSAAALARCAFSIGLDTGTTHLAAAVGVPCIAIYGHRDSPGQWSPLGDQHRLLQHPVPCGGCGHRVCPKPDHPCIRNISVEEVWDALLKQMEQAPGT